MTTTRTISRFEQLSSADDDKSAIEMPFLSPQCLSTVSDQPRHDHHHHHGGGPATAKNKNDKKASSSQPPSPLQDHRGTPVRTKTHAPCCAFSPYSPSPWTTLHATANVNLLQQEPPHPTTASTTFVDCCPPPPPPRLIVGKKLVLKSSINRPLVDKNGLKTFHPPLIQRCRTETVLPQITTAARRGPNLTRHEGEHHHHRHDNHEQCPLFALKNKKAFEQHTDADADADGVANAASQEQDITAAFEDKDALFPISGPFLAKDNSMTPALSFLEDAVDMIDDNTWWGDSSQGDDGATRNVIESGEQEEGTPSSIGTFILVSEQSKVFKTSRCCCMNVSKETTLEDLHHQRSARVSLQSQSEKTMDLRSCTYPDAVTKRNRDHHACMFKTNQKRPLVGSTSPSLDESPFKILNPLTEPISSIVAPHRQRAVRLTSAPTNKIVELKITIKGLRWGMPICCNVSEDFMDPRQSAHVVVTSRM